MHLIDDLVLGIGELLQVVVVVGPLPRPGVLVAFDEDVLGLGTRGADAVDGGLVEVQHKGLVHVVVFVVWTSLDSI